jgi:hypothetical protein
VAAAAASKMEVGESVGGWVRGGKQLVRDIRGESTNAMGPGLGSGEVQEKHGVVFASLRSAQPVCGWRASNK